MSTTMNGKGLTLALVLFCMSCSGLALADFTGEVVRVLESDTIEVLRSGQHGIRVRLYGVDCPEKGQPFGDKARQVVSDLVLGKHVVVKEKGQELFGGAAGLIIIPETGKIANHELLRAGLAWWYREGGSKDEMLEALEQEARKTKCGLWADPEPVPPWEWRKKQAGR